MKNLILITSIVTVVSLSLSWVSYGFVDFNELKEKNMNFSFSFGGGEDDAKEGSYKKFVIEDSLTNAAIKTVVVEGVSGETEISLSPDEKFHFTINGKSASEVKLQDFIEQKDDTLTVRALYKDEGWHVKIADLSSGSKQRRKVLTSQLSVKIPASVLRVGGVSVSGDLKVSGLTLDKLTTQNVSGSTEIENISTKSFVGETVSGDIEVESLTSTSIELNSVSGDIEFENLKGGPFKLKFSSVSGDVSGKDPFVGDSSSNTMTVNTISGDLDFKAL